MKIILTGATGMVGEGVLLECLEDTDVSEVLIVSRRHYDLSHPKLKEFLVPDFLHLENHAEQLTGYDACFYCAGISSIGMKEADYKKIIRHHDFICQNSIAEKPWLGFYFRKREKH